MWLTPITKWHICEGLGREEPILTFHCVWTEKEDLRGGYKPGMHSPCLKDSDARCVGIQ